MCIQSSSEFLKATGGKDEEAILIVSLLRERSGFKREVKERGDGTCREDNRTKEEETLGRKGTGTHATHLSQLHE